MKNLIRKTVLLGMLLLLLLPSAVLAEEETTAPTVPTITLSEPAAGDIWESGIRHTIHWQTQGGKDQGTVCLYYKLRRTLGWNTIACVPNTGSYLWEVPGYLNTENAQLRLIWQTQNGNGSASAVAESEPFTLRFNVEPSRPAAPSDLELVSVGSRRIELKWKDNSNNESSFSIERKTTATNWSEIDQTMANQTVFSEQYLEPGTIYDYRVRANNTQGSSQYSNELRVRTDQELVPVKLEFTFNQPTYVIEGEARPMDAAPYLAGDRLMLPLRYVGEALGAQVHWDGDRQLATVAYGTIGIQVQPGKSTAIVNGQETAIDPDNPRVMPEIVPPGRMFLPLRFVAESLGGQVAWDPLLRKAMITVYRLP